MVDDGLLTYYINDDDDGHTHDDDKNFVSIPFTCVACRK